MKDWSKTIMGNIYFGYHHNRKDGHCMNLVKEMFGEWPPESCHPGRGIEQKSDDCNKMPEMSK